MPKVSYMRSEENRKRLSARSSAGIQRYMALRSMTDDRLADKQNVTVKTIQNHLKDPGNMKLRDIWELAAILDAPVGELAGGELPEEIIGKILREKLL